MLFKCLFFSSALLLFWGIGAAQTLHFDVFHKEQSVGAVDIERKIKGNTVEYSLKSHVEVNMVFTVKINSVTQSKYENGKLTYAEAKQQSNKGVFDQHTTTKRHKEGEYQITREDKVYTVSDGDIKWTVLRLYFEEPKGQKRIFSEDNGKWYKLEYRDGKYYLEAKNPTQYVYKSGKLMEVHSSTMGGEISFIRKK